MSFSTPPTHLVVFGRPGSGKSSLAERLSEEYGFKLVRTGEMLRAAVKRDDGLGRRVSVHLANGTLVPDQLILELLEQTLKAPGSERSSSTGSPAQSARSPCSNGSSENLVFISNAISISMSVARKPNPE